MGRDLTPREMYLMEQQIIAGGLGSLWDFMEHLTVTYDGVTGPRYSPDDIAKRKQNPLLGRLFEPYDKLYSFLSQVPGGLDLLKRYEKELNDYIKAGQGDPNSPRIQWYEGKLDPNFYYRENNNALFLASVQDEAHSLYHFEAKSEQGLNHRSLEGQISSAAARQDELRADPEGSTRQVSLAHPEKFRNPGKEHKDDGR